MGTATKFSETSIRTMRRWNVVALMLLVCIVIAGCAQRDSTSDDNRSGGFYGGISGGGLSGGKGM
jgi:hypothetical protein